MLLEHEQISACVVIFVPTTTDVSQSEAAENAQPEHNVPERNNK